MRDEYREKLLREISEKMSVRPGDVFQYSHRESGDPNIPMVWLGLEDRIVNGEFIGYSFKFLDMGGGNIKIMDWDQRYNILMKNLGVEYMGFGERVRFIYNVGGWFSDFVCRHVTLNEWQGKRLDIELLKEFFFKYLSKME